MDKLTAQLSYLAQQPIFSMLRSYVDAMTNRVTLQLRGMVEPEGAGFLPFLSAGQVKAFSDAYNPVLASGKKIAVIPIVGPLTGDPNEAFWYGGTCYGDIQAQVMAADTDPMVSEIVLLVDSPGGEVIGCAETADTIFQASKPVTALIAGMSASAAYYLTAQASTVLLTPDGQVGSVGVYVVHADISQMLKDAGIQITTISAGKFKTEFSPFEPLTEEAKANMQALIDSYYADFLEAIERGRGVKSKFGDGRMFRALDAIGLGMIDGVSTVAQFFESKKPTAGKVYAQQKALEAL